jgi:RND family efflux transporter MFP subunit
MMPSDSSDRITTPVIADHHESSSVLPSRPHRRTFWISLLGLALLITGIGFGWRLWQGNRSTAQSQSAAQRAASVKLTTVNLGTVQESAEFVGNLDSLNSLQLRPEVNGRVSQIFVRSGDRVEAGTRLIELNPDVQQAEVAGSQANVNSAIAARNTAQQELQALQAEREAAVAEVDLQNTEYQRRAQLFQAGAISRSELDVRDRDRRAASARLRAANERVQAARASLTEAGAAVEQAQAQADAANATLQNGTITAPFAGIVGDVPIKVGDFVSTTDTLGSLVQNNQLELRLSVPLERAPLLRTGLPVELSDPQGKPLGTGRINFVEPQVQANAQSILAKAIFDNPQGQLRDQQFVRSRVIWSTRSGILVPTTAISRFAGQPFVFVAKPQQVEGQPPLVAEQRPVKLGSLQGNQYHVLEGLQAGERIVVAGTLGLANNAPLNAQP